MFVFCWGKESHARLSSKKSCQKDSLIFGEPYNSDSSGNRHIVVRNYWERRNDMKISWFCRMESMEIGLCFTQEVHQITESGVFFDI